ncbi:hypothetical protein BKA69DRAFT_1042074 [Paraphysoderma sedebokerense]|nr:hypothetical protein BKA69DRAFT_1042074 [Paraphysoderma sedebokerense]
MSQQIPPNSQSYSPPAQSAHSEPYLDPNNYDNYPVYDHSHQYSYSAQIPHPAAAGSGEQPQYDPNLYDPNYQYQAEYYDSSQYDPSYQTAYETYPVEDGNLSYVDVTPSYPKMPPYAHSTSTLVSDAPTAVQVLQNQAPAPPEKQVDPVPNVPIWKEKLFYIRIFIGIFSLISALMLSAVKTEFFNLIIILYPVQSVSGLKYTLYLALNSISTGVAIVLVFLMLTGSQRKDPSLKRLKYEFGAGFGLFVSYLILATIFWFNRSADHSDIYSVVCEDEKLFANELPATREQVPGLCRRSNVTVAFGYIVCLFWAISGAYTLLKRRDIVSRK